MDRFSIFDAIGGFAVALGAERMALTDRVGATSLFIDGDMFIFGADGTLMAARGDVTPEVLRALSEARATIGDIVVGTGAGEFRPIDERAFDDAIEIMERDGRHPIIEE